ncbi:MAG: rod shape-determining protein MreD [Thermodesulfovibrionales bacterium]
MKTFKKSYLDHKGFPVLASSKKWQVILFWTLIVAVLIVIKTNVTLFGVSLNLTVLIPFYFGLKRSPEKGLLAGVIVGLVEDSLSNTILGPNILSKGTVGMLSSLLSGRFFIWTPLFGIAACFAMSFLDVLIVYMSRELFFVNPGMFKHAAMRMFIQSLINAPIGYFIRPKDE